MRNLYWSVRVHVACWVGSLVLMGATASAWANPKLPDLDEKSDKILRVLKREAVPECGSDCGVTKVFFQTEDHRSYDPDLGVMYYTRMNVGFEAKDWESAQEYAFVQVIRGCAFTDELKPDGTRQQVIRHANWHLDKRQIFTFPEWSYDANSTDPLYYGPQDEDSHLEGGRLSLYRWTPRVGSYDKKQTRALYEVLRMPKAERSKLKPRLYVEDWPSAARKDSYGDYTNIALDFKICLYRLKDIPESVETDDLSLLPAPIHCETWDSQFEYSPKARKFEHRPGAGLHPFCATQQPMPPDVHRQANP